MKLRSVLRSILACFLIAAFLHGADQTQFAEIAAMEDGLSAITGLRFTRKVPYAVINKEQLRRYLEQRIKDAIKPAELHAEELTLKMLGLVPSDFDLRQNTVDLMTEQAAAFYDYNKKKLFILEGTANGAEERVALVHELAHALADQHFRLAKYIHEGSRSDDGSTARLAVMEGQASWLMTAYMSKQAGGPAEVLEQMRDMMSRGIAASAAQYPVFSKAPAYIRESLVFPYSSGMLFQDAVYRKLGKDSFSEVFRNPPAGTQQILHPERYLAHVVSKNPSPPAVPQSRSLRILAEGNLGEFDYRVLLTQHAGKDEGAAAAGHLAGSSYELLEYKHNKSPVLAFASTWGSEESAQKFFDLYRRVLKGKWKTLEITSDAPSSVEGRGDSGYFRAWVSGVTVNHIEGAESPLH
jgi:hypothetical protein